MVVGLCLLAQALFDNLGKRRYNFVEESASFASQSRMERSWLIHKWKNWILLLEWMYLDQHSEKSRNRDTC